MHLCASYFFYIFSVSHTTRQPRPGEVDGKDYHFSTMDAMKEGIAKGLIQLHGSTVDITHAYTRFFQQGDFLESAMVHGNLYGTSRGL